MVSTGGPSWGGSGDQLRFERALGLQQARRDRPPCRSPPGVAARELVVGDKDIPARNGQPAYRIRPGGITNIPVPGDRRPGDRLGPPRAMAPQPLPAWLNKRCVDA